MKSLYQCNDYFLLNCRNDQSCSFSFNHGTHQIWKLQSQTSPEKIIPDEMANVLSDSPEDAELNPLPTAGYSTTLALLPKALL